MQEGVIVFWPLTWIEKGSIAFYLVPSICCAQYGTPGTGHVCPFFFDRGGAQTYPCAWGGGRGMEGVNKKTGFELSCDQTEDRPLGCCCGRIFCFGNGILCVRTAVHRSTSHAPPARTRKANTERYPLSGWRRRGGEGKRLCWRTRQGTPSPVA